MRRANRIQSPLVYATRAKQGLEFLTANIKMISMADKTSEEMLLLHAKEMAVLIERAVNFYRFDYIPAVKLDTVMTLGEAIESSGIGSYKLAMNAKKVIEYTLKLYGMDYRKLRIRGRMLPYPDARKLLASVLIEILHVPSIQVAHLLNLTHNTTNTHARNYASSKMKWQPFQNEYQQVVDMIKEKQWDKI